MTSKQTKKFKEIISTVRYEPKFESKSMADIEFTAMIGEVGKGMSCGALILEKMLNTKDTIYYVPELSCDIKEYIKQIRK